MDKLQRKFNRYIKPYRKFCIKYGYPSFEIGTIIKYFHEKKLNMVNISGGYWLEYQGNKYLLNDLIEIFKIERG